MMGKRICILGGGLAGCTAALMAKEAGFEPVIIERRSYLGFEINGRYQIFTEAENWDIYEQNGRLNLKGEKVKNEICFFQGETKAGLMKQIYEADIPCLLFTHAAGLICDERGAAAGLILANSYGEYLLPADAVLDCTGDGVLKNMVAGYRESSIHGSGNTVRASFAFELECAAWKEELLELEGDSLWDGKVQLHPSKRGADTRIAVFEVKIPMKEDMNPAYTRSYIEHTVKAEMVSVISRIRDHVQDSFVYLINMAAEAATEPEADGSFCNFTGLYENPCPISFPFTPDSLLRMETAWKDRMEEICLEKDFQKNPGSVIYMNGRKHTIEEALTMGAGQGLEIGPMKLPPVRLNPELFEKLSTGTAVAGLGAAGMAALYGLGADASFAGVESQYILGGTRTAGHVINYYYGRQGGFTKKLNAEFLNFDRSILKTPEHDREKFGYVDLALMHHYRAAKKKQPLLLGTVVCDVIKEENKVTGLVFVNETGIFSLSAAVCIDTTGNGDAAVLAGADYVFGADEDGICQTYSQWGVEERVHENFHHRSTVGDYDMADTTKYEDLLRASMVAQMKNSSYYSSNPVSYREGRRIVGRDYIDIKSAVRNDPVKEPIAVAVSTIDNHGKTTADFARMGFCAVAREYKVTLPLGCFIPKGLEGILVGGKAVSVDKDTLAVIRMNADVQNAGYALGYIARLMAENGGKAVQYSEIEEFLQREDLIPDEYTKRKFPDAQEAAAVLTEKEPYSLLNVILQKKEEVLPFLLDAYAACDRRLLIAKALAWFGDASGRDLIIERLLWLKDHENTDPSCDIAERSDTVRHGMGEELNDYWEMNQLIEVAGRIRNPKITKLLCSLMESCETGGPPYESRFPYFKARREETCIPYYERIFNLVHVFYSSPDREAVKALESLLEKEFIGGGHYAEKITDEPFMMASYLEVTIAAAAFRCGSARGRAILEKYAEDVRSVYAKMARKELHH